MATTRAIEGDGDTAEAIKYQRRQSLPGVELRTVFDSSRCYRFYSTGFEFLVPVTWRGEVWHMPDNHSRHRTRIVHPPGGNDEQGRCRAGEASPRGRRYRAGEGRALAR